MLKIKIPNFLEKEQNYVLNILLGEFLGLDFKIETYEGNIIEITRVDNFDKFSKLTLNVNFFHNAKHHWLKNQSLPVLPLETWNPVEDGIEVNLVKSSIPILYGTSGVIKKKKSYSFKFRYFWKCVFYAYTI